MSLALQKENQALRQQLENIPPNDDEALVTGQNATEAIESHPPNTQGDVNQNEKVAVIIEAVKKINSLDQREAYLKEQTCNHLRKVGQHLKIPKSRTGNKDYLVPAILDQLSNV